jgi:hypothetical protein
MKQIEKRFMMVADGGKPCYNVNVNNASRESRQWSPKAVVVQQGARGRLRWRDLCGRLGSAIVSITLFCGQGASASLIFAHSTIRSN